MTSFAPFGRAALCAVLLLLAPAGSAWPARVAGVDLPPTETAGGRRLPLVGCAPREVFWTDFYVVSLYLPRPPRDASDVLGAPAPQVARLDVTYEGRLPDGLPDDWQERLREEVSREFLRTLREHYDRLRHGDTMRATYVPGEGTRVTVNGRVVASRPGRELMDDLLGLWIGRNPVSENMKRRLLSGSC